jgi:hypothetical protein
MPNLDMPAPTIATPLPSFLCPRISPPERELIHVVRYGPH